MYGLYDDELIARQLNRPETSIQKMAKRVFPDTRRDGPWTAKEVQELKRYLGASTPGVIARILHRTEQEVEERILELGRIRNTGRWSREENAKLKRVYGTRTDINLGKIFGRPGKEIEKQARKLCLAKDKAFIRKISGEPATRMPRWTEEEIVRLAELYPLVANLEIAKKLRRSVKSVVSKAHNLGLKKDRERLRKMGQVNVQLRYKRKG
ncbi:MAG: hypothetical protein O7B99_08350 [Planctomycetota bacterium]|nr:hypothetical protein [Planctomycetota bacterium]